MELEEYCIDSQKIDRYEVTEEGYVRLWVSVAVADKDLEYYTDSGKRIEYIDSDNLFDKVSLKTAMGKPFSINHPPEPILIDNYSRYAVGTSLQEFINDDSRLVVSGLITDPIAVKGIIDKDIQFTSSAYRAVKELQADGRYKQVKRHYNHFALLTADESPRAGIDSTIILDSTSSNKTMTTPPTVPATVPPTVPATEPTQVSNNDAMLTKLFGIVETLSTKVDALTASTIPTVTTDSADKVDTSEDTAKLITDSTTDLVGLWAEWKSTIEKYNKTVDYSLDSMGVKKLVLSCFYKTDALDKLTDKPTLDGFWLNFEAEKEAKKKANNNPQNIRGNLDSTTEDHRNKFVEMTTKKIA